MNKKLLLVLAVFLINTAISGKSLACPWEMGKVLVWKKSKVKEKRKIVPLDSILGDMLISQEKTWLFGRTIYFFPVIHDGILHLGGRKAILLKKGDMVGKIDQQWCGGQWRPVSVCVMNRFGDILYLGPPLPDL
jgi:hypothetical protein